MKEGIIFAPYVPVTVATYINDEMVWHRNRWIRLGLKIKRIFIKPKYLKNIETYTKKTVSNKYYGTIKISNN